jgi:hypothetical protein
VAAVERLQQSQQFSVQKTDDSLIGYGLSIAGHVIDLGCRDLLS